MISKLAVVDKEMVASRLGGLLTYSNFVHAVSGATVSFNFVSHYQSCQTSIWDTFIACVKCTGNVYPVVPDVAKIDKYLIFKRYCKCQ